MSMPPTFITGCGSQERLKDEREEHFLEEDGASSQGFQEMDETFHAFGVFVVLLIELSISLDLTTFSIAFPIVVKGMHWW